MNLPQWGGSVGHTFRFPLCRCIFPNCIFQTVFFRTAFSKLYFFRVYFTKLYFSKLYFSKLYFSKMYLFSKCIFPIFFFNKTDKNSLRSKGLPKGPFLHFSFCLCFNAQVGNLSMGWSGYRVNVRLANIDNMTYFFICFWHMYILSR